MIYSEFIKILGRNAVIIYKSVWILLLLCSCERFFDPVQEGIILKEDFPKGWEEYRSAEMGLYSLQQRLVDQIVILGELRGDLLEVTPNADIDLNEIYNFAISKNNKYASPVNFYVLISACNSLINLLEDAHPEVLDKSLDATSYDRLYGEVLCMRAWAYFNAVRIYEKVPYIWPSLTTAEEIIDYVNSGAQYIDTLNIIYGPGGYYNDTIRNDTVILEKKYLNIAAVIDTFTNQLENKIKAVGVIHNMENGDLTWDVTVWNEYAWHCLLGQMYLYDGNLTSAARHFDPIMYNDDTETSNIRFGLDNKFETNSWKNIFSGIDPYEHILTLWFSKSYQQQNNLQNLFSDIPPNKYMLKPSMISIQNWESIWDGMEMDIDNNDPAKTEIKQIGIPGDFYRGHGISYAYVKDGIVMNNKIIKEVLEHKRLGNKKDIERIMSNVDTVVFKYSYEKNSYDQDANFIIYRAASIHLYYSEIYARWEFDHQGVIRPEVLTSLNILNNGSYIIDQKHKGVRGRVGFGEGDDAVKISNIIYYHDPLTNEIAGWYDFTDDLLAKQQYIEDKIMDERARELAFEGERFYDLIRIAKRRNDPAYLADKVAAKFTGAKAEQIRNLLMDEKNWYVPFF